MKEPYARIVIMIKAEDSDVSERELELSDKVSELIDKIEDLYEDFPEFECVIDEE